jgi:selenide,water dikinase
MSAADPASVRLTAFSHGGGCGCKIAPGLLREILSESAPSFFPPELLVGRESSDDAAVYQLDEHQAIVATTDFFMPIVDDPRDFGRIAATNAISDIYAMGARPVMALAIVCMPIAKLPVETIRAILDGGQSVCAEAGIVIAGGHTIDSVEPIYGLAVLGVVNPRNLKKNCTARPGDRLILGKPLGVGIYSAALKQGKLSSEQYALMIATTTQLNAVGTALGALPGVHALTDVTGFGLLGHALEVCRGSGVGAVLRASRIPALPGALAFAEGGVLTGASGRNWSSYGSEVRFDAGLPREVQGLLTDPQTSGGLLVSCDPHSEAEVLQRFRAAGFASAAVIGEICEGPSGIFVARGE